MLKTAPTDDCRPIATAAIIGAMIVGRRPIPKGPVEG